MDLRKPPSKFQRSAIKKFADVISGKAAVVETSKASEYKKAYRTKGNKVVVPRIKGEKVDVDKKGNIVSIRKTRTGKVRRRHIPVKELETTARERRPANVAVTYVVPFQRKGGGISWRRFTPEALRRFIAEYGATKKTPEGRQKFKDWLELAIEERLVFDDREEKQEYLEEHNRYITGETINPDEIQPKERAGLQEWAKRFRDEGMME